MKTYKVRTLNKVGEVLGTVHYTYANLNNLFRYQLNRKESYFRKSLPEEAVVVEVFEEGSDTGFAYTGWRLAYTGEVGE